jgi:predicted phosphodiesterase
MTGSAVRIALIGDSHGFLPALEAVVAAARAAGPDLIVHCGDLVTLPFSPDPPGESIDLLQAEGVPTIYGNHELMLRAWGTPEWEPALALRLARGYAPGPWVRFVGAGQDRLRPADLAWLRALPEDMALPERVYLTHSLPGNPFLSLDGGDEREQAIAAAEREAAFARPGAAEAELILCGHAHSPKLLQLPRQLVVRTGAAIGPSVLPGTEARRGDYALVTRRSAGWQVAFGTTEWRPRDPGWHWLRPIQELERR